MNKTFVVLMGTILTVLPHFSARAESAIELFQKFRTVQVVENNNRRIELVNLNSNVNSWYLLRSTDLDGKTRSRTINLQNPRAPKIQMRLDSKTTDLQFFAGSKMVDSCTNWEDAFRPTNEPFAPICNNRLYVRNRSDGYQPAIEKGAEFFRENFGAAGEWLVDQAKSNVFEGRYAEDASLTDDPSTSGIETKALRPAPLDKRYQGQTLARQDLGIHLAKPFTTKEMKVGEWYPAEWYPHVYVSILAPGMISKDILSSYSDHVQQLQPREINSLAYLVAFDMKTYSMGWAHGTRLPGVGWSERMHAEARRRFGGGQGPDGFNSFGELINPGQVPPSEWARTVATISGGFQLRHSHFMNGYYATVNKAGHYGFIDDGVIMSSPKPGLSTIIVYTDGSFNLKTWTEEDNNELSRIRYLRQNGLPMVDLDSHGTTVPNSYVGNRRDGNWSGSAAGDNYTPRGAACLIERGGEQYFVYGYFSAATPNAIARVFQAYGCKSAIHLDMNSPGQAYMTLVSSDGRKIESQHLVNSMSSADPGRQLPRYLAVPDFRDFFWITVR